MWPSFISTFVSGHHRYWLSICDYSWPREIWGVFFIFQKLSFFPGNRIQIQKCVFKWDPLFSKFPFVLASLLLHHQENKYLRLPGYSVLRRNHSLFISVSQQSSRDHYKHREAKAGLYLIPMVLSDPHAGKKQQR